VVGRKTCGDGRFGTMIIWMNYLYCIFCDQRCLWLVYIGAALMWEVQRQEMNEEKNEMNDWWWGWRKAYLLMWLDWLTNVGCSDDTRDCRIQSWIWLQGMNVFYRLFLRSTTIQVCTTTVYSCLLPVGWHPGPGNITKRSNIPRQGGLWLRSMKN
jgi:hypothetical protein